DLFDEVATAHRDVEARHHQDDEHPVIIVSEHKPEIELRHHQSLSSSLGVWLAKAMKSDSMTEATVTPTPNATMRMPHSCACCGCWGVRLEKGRKGDSGTEATLTRTPNSTMRMPHSCACCGCSASA